MLIKPFCGHWVYSTPFVLFFLLQTRLPGQYQLLTTISLTTQ